MYHNSHDGTIELYDDVVIESASLSKEEGEPRKLTVVYVLREDKELHPTDLPRLHSTNGVNHSYVQLPVIKDVDEAPVDEVEVDVELDSDEPPGEEVEATVETGRPMRLPSKRAKKEAE
jgi:hypothetical protein